MSIQSRSTIKSYFETGDRPTQGQFIHFLDSYVHMSDTNYSDITIIGTIQATTGSFDYLNMTGTTAFDSITVGGGYGSTGLTITNTGLLSTNANILSDGNITATNFIIGNASINETDLEQIDDITAGAALASKALVLDSNKNIATINSLTAIHITSSYGKFLSNITSSDALFTGIVSSSIFSGSYYGNFVNPITSSDALFTGTVSGSVFSGSYYGDGSNLTGIDVEEVHGNKPTITGSLTVPENENNTIVTSNTGEFTVPIGSEYTVSTGAEVDLQYTVIAERLFRIDPSISRKTNSFISMPKPI